MRFASSSSLQCLIAAAATDVNMSSFRAYPRGGRNSYRREFCSRPPNGSRETFITGDSHLRSVRDANYGFRQGGGGNFRNSGGFQGQPYHPPPPFRQRQPFPPPRTKPWDYRNWEYALSQPPSHWERFVVLSYNILAAYLALDHRRELYYHIPFYVLDWEWRKKKIVFELGLWSPDIMCLQEVDRFQDLENELKVHGYDGIWKMRTGKPVDGCAVFWRTARFKLRHEESIEFRNLGLRDNVAQICVFESRNQNLGGNESAELPTSLSDTNQVVVCNIHVLYNPKRGEIKLGQVRVLLERAHAVSKLWNDAPVVLCGDFNCTPKSPLYNLISGQKLNLIGLARDQVSGQASAEISRPKPNYPNPGSDLHRFNAESPENLVGTSSLVDLKVDVNQSNHLSNVPNHRKPHHYVGNLSSAENLVEPHNSSEVIVTPEESGSDVQYNNENITISDAMEKEKEEEIIDGANDGLVSLNYVSLEYIKESPSGPRKEDVPAVDLENDGVQEATSPVDSYKIDNVCLEIESGNVEKPSGTTAYSIHRTSSEHSQSNLYSSDLVIETTQEGTVYDDIVKENLEVMETTNPSTSYQSTSHVETSSTATCIDLDVEQKLGNMSVSELSEVTEGGSFDQEHGSKSSSERCNTEDVPIFHVGADSKSVRLESAEADQSSGECATIPYNSDLTPLTAEVQNHSSSSIDSEPAKMERYIYDPYSWTPMEIETASGNAECTLLEHPLKLKSTYAEVEDYSGTRDPESREPQVTSYNRRFLGTVDYIWCSEGLQTVKVLDTLPKQALQHWSAGFPTKKWGSDHIALASQLAFKKDVDKS